MNKKLLSVASKRLELKPNLQDFDKESRRFSYSDQEYNLTFFPKHKINAAYNAVDRHVLTWRKNKIALFWEGEDGSTKKYSFLDLSIL